MLKNKLLRKRLAAVVLAAALAFTSVDMTSFAAEVSGGETEYVESLVQNDISGDEDFSEDEMIDASEEVPSEEETTLRKTDEEILEEFMGEYEALSYHEMEEDQAAPLYERDEDNRYNGETIPSSYNSSVDTLATIYPGTRNQNPWGSCWAHSAIANAEISLVTQGYATTSVNFSELALAYFFYNTVIDPMGGTNGDYTTLGVGSGETLSNVKGTYNVNVLDRGGNNCFTWRSLATWMGVIDESLAPYAPYNSYTSESVSYLDPDLAYQNQAILTDVRILNSSDKEGIKRAIMENGIVGCSYKHNSSYYKSGDGYSCFYTTATGSNHAVAIVGWDDNFPASNFWTTPEGNGAWLVRNSWSYNTGASSSSYFWISYYDASLNSNNFYEQIYVPADTYDNNYQYDGGTETSSAQSRTVANIFTIGGTGGAAYEDLKTVSFSSSYSNMGYTIKVYQGLTDATNPESGTLVATKSGTTTYSGYYTVLLDQPVKMAKGTKFSVVIETTNGYIDREYKNTVNYWIKMYCNVDEGESFCKYSAGWSDCINLSSSYYGNVCIKAFTCDSDSSTTPAVQKYTIKFDGNGSTSGSMNPVEASTAVNAILPTNAFTRTYYKFLGWNTKPDGTGTSYADGATVTARAANTTLTLYAQWDENFYSIIYNGNGNTAGVMNNSICSNGSNVTVRSNSFSKTGYKFVSWNTKADGTGTTYAPFDTFYAIPVKTSVTLYAQWTPNQYTVYLYSNNGKSETTTLSGQKANEKFVFPACTFEYEGYEFVGWGRFSSVSYCSTIYKPGDEIDAPLKYDGGSTYYYALWQAKQDSYKLCFYKDSGAALYDYKIIKYGDPYGELPTPTKVGFTFNGWFTAAFEGTQVTATTTLTVKEDVNLYAHWTPIRYNIYLYANNGSEDKATYTDIYYDVVFTFPENTFTYEGYVFEGWCTNSSGIGTVYKPGDQISGATSTQGATVNYYAKWKEADSFTIHFYTDNGVTEDSWRTRKYGEAYGELPVPENPGYEFLGWFTAYEGGTQVYKTTTLSVKEDVNLYAHWKFIISNTVTFDLDGGYFTVTTENPVTIFDNGAVTRPADPAKANCEFLGWKLEGASDYYDFSSSVTADITLVAQWRYTLTASLVYADPESGSEIETGEEIILYSQTQGATIYYTLDGSIPTEASAVYSAPISFEAAGSYVIKAFAVKEGYNPGEVSEFEFTVTAPIEDWGDVLEEDRIGYTHPRELPTGLWVAGIDESVEYTGYAIKFDNLRVYDNKTRLVNNVSYRISYRNNLNAGIATVTITGVGNYTGLINKSFTITPTEINPYNVTVPDVKYKNKKGTAFSNVRIIGLNGAILKKGTDFTVNYTYMYETLVKVGSKNVTRMPGDAVGSNDIVPCGTYISVTISGKGNYKTSTPVTDCYEVTSEGIYDISKASVTIAAQTYTGAPIDLSGQIRVKLGSTYLTEGEDFEISGYSADRTNKGTATVTISGIYNPENDKYYVGAKTVKFTIKAKALSATEIDFPETEYEYTGSAIKPVVTFTDGLNTLVEGRDYTVKYTNNVNIPTSKKTPTVTVTGKGNYSGTVKKTFNINRQTLLDTEITSLDIAPVYATNAANSYKTKVTLVDRNGRNLTENKDYKLSYLKDEVPVSSSYRPAESEEYTLRITGCGGYTGDIDRVIIAQGQTPVSEAFTVFVEDFENEGIYVSYNEETAKTVFAKNGAKLNVMIYDAGASEYLTEGTDYALSYKNNKSRASYTSSKAPTLVITGKGKYKGTLNLKFNIVENTIDNATVTAADKVYSTSKNGFVSKPIVKDVFGSTLKAGSDYTVTYRYATDTYTKKGVLRTKDTVIPATDVLTVGTQVKLEITGKGNYTGTWTSQETYTGSGICASYKIVAGNLSKAKVSINNQNYTGKALTPGKTQMTVKIGKTILGADDYEIVSYSNNIAKGTAKVVLKGKGNYAGTKTATFKITQRTMYMTVVFNGNGATGGSMKNMYVASGKPSKLSGFGFTKAGYVSDRASGVWNTEPDGSGTYYADGENIENTGHNGDNLVLYAQWMEIGKTTSISVYRASSVSNASTQQVVSWSPVAGASGYVVYRATSFNGSYSKIGTTTQTSYTSKNLSGGKIYYYRIAATVSETVNGKRTTITGNMSDTSGSFRTYAKPSLKGFSYITYYGDNIIYTSLKNNGSQTFEIMAGQSVSYAGKKTIGNCNYTFSGSVFYDGNNNTIYSGSSQNTYIGGGFGIANYAGAAFSCTFYAKYDGIKYQVTVSSSGDISYKAISYLY